MQEYGRALDGVEGVAVLHGAGNHHRIDPLSGGEHIGVAREHVAFVGVGYGVREIDGVGGILQERLFEADYQVLASKSRFRGLLLRRGEEYVGRLLDGDELIEAEDELGALHRHSDSPRKRAYVDYVWRDGVLGAPGRSLGGVGA